MRTADTKFPAIVVLGGGSWYPKSFSFFSTSGMIFLLFGILRRNPTPFNQHIVPLLAGKTTGSLAPPVSGTVVLCC